MPSTPPPTGPILATGLHAQIPQVTLADVAQKLKEDQISKWIDEEISMMQGISNLPSQPTTPAQAAIRARAFEMANDPNFHPPPFVYDDDTCTTSNYTPEGSQQPMDLDDDDSDIEIIDEFQSSPDGVTFADLEPPQPPPPAATPVHIHHVRYLRFV